MGARQLSDPLRFLLRALAFLTLMLALWWMVLLSPLLAGYGTGSSGGSTAPQEALKP